MKNANRLLSRVVRLEAGFTLVELMIVVAVVGILSAIAIPSYQRYVLQSRRAEAQSYMQQLALRQEQHWAKNQIYAADNSALGGVDDKSEYYTFTVSNTPTPATTYTVTAVAKGSQLKDSQCLTLTLDQTGTKGGGTSCWRK